jgi:hypothetical protein
MRHYLIICCQQAKSVEGPAPVTLAGAEVWGAELSNWVRLWKERTTDGRPQ